MVTQRSFGTGRHLTRTRPGTFLISLSVLVHFEQQGSTVSCMAWSPRSQSHRAKPAPKARARRGFGIRPRLAAIVLLPTAAAITLLALHVSDIFAQADTFDEAQTVSATLPATYALAGAITTERDARALHGNTTKLATATDEAVTQWRAQVGNVAGYDSEIRKLYASNTALDDIRTVAADPEQASLAYQQYSSLANHLLDVASSQADQLHAQIVAHRSSARRDALLSTIGTALAILFTLLASILVAQSIIRPLRALSASALEVARRGLSERVRLIESSEHPDRHTIVEPLGVQASGEMAEVANAFDEVHARAVLLAAEQAKTRSNVQHMFVNLARRSQSLVDRQLRLIDQLEEREQNPAQLGALFQLDHLATRMRRNDTSLMVLADIETNRARRNPVAIVDVLRAAASEVDQYARVDLNTSEIRAITGAVADDLIHLLAELVENATNFSPPDTSVVLRAHQPGPRAELKIEIEDHGIGMSNDDLALANAKVRTLSELDAESARMMGLFVVARLARRHRLHVELRANRDRGVTAIVSVPPELVTHASEETRPPVFQARDVIASQQAQSDTRSESQFVETRSVEAIEPPPIEYVPIEPPITEPAFTTPAPVDASMEPAPIEDESAARLLVADALAEEDTRVELSYAERVAQRLGPPAEPSDDLWEPTDAEPTRGPSLISRIAPRGAVAQPARHVDMPEAEADEQATAPAEPYDALASEWFTRRLLPTREELQAQVALADQQAALVEPDNWTSPGDAGWRTAAELAEPEPLSTTSDGLPVRVPGRHLMPGSAGYIGSDGSDGSADAFDPFTPQERA